MQQNTRSRLIFKPRSLARPMATSHMLKPERCLSFDKAERLAFSAGSLHIRSSRNSQNLPEKRLRLPALMEWQSWPMGHQTPTELCNDVAWENVARIVRPDWDGNDNVCPFRSRISHMNLVSIETTTTKEMPRPRQHEREPDDSDL